MTVATSSNRVGVRDLSNNLSRHLQRVKAGGEIVVTERGRPIARVIPIDASTDRLAELIAAGRVTPPTNRGPRHVPTPIKTQGSVSDLIERR